MRTLVSRASLSARTSASERSQHCSSSYRTPDDRPSYPPSPSSLFPNYPLIFRGGSYRPRIGRQHRLRPKSSPSPEILQDLILIPDQLTSQLGPPDSLRIRSIL